jgi:ABC-type Mn2+/Zn2+ transport system ATPase subunit
MVTAHNLGVGYLNEILVANISFCLEEGKILALVGANGSGKTTLLKTIAGLIKPITGKIEVFNAKPLKHPSRVAYLGQFHPSSLMLPLRVYDVVRMSRFALHGLFGRMTPQDDQAVQEAMSIMDISNLAEAPLNSISGGQRQRVFLAQAFARDADLILLDEPAANLDASTCDMYRHYLHNLASAGKSIIVATHDISEAAEYDWTMLLAHRVVAYGKSTEILTQASLLATFGIIGDYKDGKIVIVEREHGHE